MNTKELKIKLDEAGISSNSYSLDGNLMPMKIILSFSNSKWSVFLYDERGRVLGLKQFNTESEACQHMLKTLIYDKEWHEKYNLKII